MHTGLINNKLQNCGHNIKSRAHKFDRLTNKFQSCAHNYLELCNYIKKVLRTRIKVMQTSYKIVLQRDIQYSFRRKGLYEENVLTNVLIGIKIPYFMQEKEMFYTFVFLIQLCPNLTILQ